jgi:excisionase family DNA binding protein
MTPCSAQRISNARPSKGTAPKHSLIESSVWRQLPRAIFIALATVIAFWPSLQGTWVFSDDVYVTVNPLLNDPDRLWKIWFAPGSQVNYFPLESTVQYLQWTLWGYPPKLSQSSLTGSLESSPDDELWTTPQVAKYLHVSLKTVFNLRKKGLPYVQLGGAVRFVPQEIKEYLIRSRGLSSHRLRQMARKATVG